MHGQQNIEIAFLFNYPANRVADGYRVLWRFTAFYFYNSYMKRFLPSNRYSATRAKDRSTKHVSHKVSIAAATF